ncbi:hypothetical protein DID88_001703 [Monilinia fructigena]|uniref:RNase H type-1 domain-containing protein n=1 Tax=Monilinia fructigena TaxID=38457 RepID=A0A395IWJ8_9HELO|nr:hypothetical protein DID88_001703 [Monilinia fructigena]
MGIEDNEMADELADAGAKEGRMDNDRSAEPTISGIGTTARALANVTTSDCGDEDILDFRRHTASGNSDMP